MKVRVVCRKFECIYTLYDPNRDQLQKMQLQGLAAGNRNGVLWITRPVLYH